MESSIFKIRWLGLNSSNTIRDQNPEFQFPELQFPEYQFSELQFPEYSFSRIGPINFPKFNRSRNNEIEHSIHVNVMRSIFGKLIIRDIEYSGNWLFRLTTPEIDYSGNWLIGKLNIQQIDYSGNRIFGKLITRETDYSGNWLLEKLTLFRKLRFGILKFRKFTFGILICNLKYVSSKFLVNYTFLILLHSNLSCQKLHSRK